jgi:hypothetical protein
MLKEPFTEEAAGVDCREESTRYEDTIGRRQIQSLGGENVEIQDIYTYSRSGLYHSGRCGRSWKGNQRGWAQDGEDAELPPGRRTRHVTDVD